MQTQSMNVYLKTAEKSTALIVQQNVERGKNVHFCLLSFNLNSDTITPKKGCFSTFC